MRLLCFLLAFNAAAQTGVPPRAAAGDYPVHDTVSGASIVPAGQVAKVFSSAIAKDYLVVEFSVFPENGKTIDLDGLDFALNSGPDSRSYPATPEEAAWHGRKPPAMSQSGPGPHVVGEVGVLVGARTDPVTGKVDHGVATYGGIGVDNRPQPPAATAPVNPSDDPYAIEGRLRRMALPGGQTDRPMAGYLYFPISAKGFARKPRSGAFRLEYSLNGQRSELALPVR